jgi:hypothetical protein
LRDQVRELKRALDGKPSKETKPAGVPSVSYRKGKRSSSKRANAPF